MERDGATHQKKEQITEEILEAADGIMSEALAPLKHRLLAVTEENYAVVDLVLLCRDIDTLTSAVSERIRDTVALGRMRPELEEP